LAVLGAAALLVLGAGCGNSRAAEQHSAPGAVANLAPKAPGLSFALTLAADARTMDVEIRVTGPQVAEVRALRATRAWAGTHALAGVQNLEVRDTLGAISVGPPAEEDAFSVLPLSRAPSGDELALRYRARTGAEASRFALHRGSAGVSGVGHSFVVRPALAATLPLALRFRTEGESAGFVTSLDGRTAATVEDLAEAVFVAGAVRTEALPSGDRAAVAFGSGIEGRAAIELAASTRAKAASTFGLAESERRPLSLFVIGERGIGKEHDGAALGGALALWLDAGRTLDDGAKILIAHEALHGVFGGAIRVAADGREASWFSEGFATHYARRMLFDQGQIDAAAFLADVARGNDERSDGASAEARDERSDGASAEARDERSDGASAEARDDDYARGAGYAAQLDVAVRARSRGKRTLDDVVRGLAGLAMKTPGAPIAVSAFRAAVAAEVGEAKELALWDGLVAKTPPELPEQAFGPCFRRVSESRSVFQLGFDPASLRSRFPIIRGTIEGSAAARAGVRDGAMVLKSNVRADEEIAPAFTVELLLTDPKGKKRVRYKPSQTLKTSVFQPQPCKRAQGA